LPMNPSCWTSSISPAVSDIPGTGLPVSNGLWEYSRNGGQ
jgi:hypothetical protein